jgi:hypothetical protein
MIAKVVCLVEAYIDLAAELGKFLRDGLREAVRGGFVVAGRFDFDQLADGRDDRIAAVAEVSKTTLRFGARESLLSSQFSVLSLEGIWCVSFLLPFAGS